MAAATASPADHVPMVASWRALAGHTCHPWKGQLSLPAGGTHHCLCARPRGTFRGLLAAGVAARTAAAARRAGSAIGARKGDRSIMFALRRCSVDSDAVLLRARHGGRHEGGGRREAEGEDELHLLRAGEFALGRGSLQATRSRSALLSLLFLCFSLDVVRRWNRSRDSILHNCFRSSSVCTRSPLRRGGCIVLARGSTSRRSRISLGRRRM